jgi:galactofuranose transport system permease protein
MLESLISVLLFYTPPNMISQVGTLTSYSQQVLTGRFPIVVASLQTYLARKHAY